MRPRWLVLVALVMFTVGCRADVVVDVAIEADGSGTVTVDVAFDEAAAAALGDIASELVVHDLAAAGWAVTHPGADEAGNTTVRASKPVDSPDQLQGVLDEIAGPGVFTDVRIDPSESFGQRRHRLQFAVDAGAGWNLISDERVAEAFGEPFDRVVEDLAGPLQFDETVAIEVRGRIVAADGQVGAQEVVRPGAGTGPVRLDLAAFSERPTAILLRWVALALASLFALSVVLAMVGWWLQRRADRLRPVVTPANLGTRIPGQKRAAAVRGEVRDLEPATDAEPVRLIVVEPLAVLYALQASPATYLLEFVRHNGGATVADEIMNAHDQLLVGSITTDELWHVAGLVGDTDGIDEVFTEMRWLRDGTKAFLDELDRRRVPLAAISNDAADWSELIRERDGLTSVWPWLVSGSVGTVKTDPAMFELLHRQTGISFGHCLYLDTDPRALDAARELGLRTAWFAPTRDPEADASPHPVVRDLRHLVPR